ncbi:MAG: hypothetical protein ABIG68_07495 [Acidobacteriota bacterium]
MKAFAKSSVWLFALAVILGAVEGFAAKPDQAAQIIREDKGKPTSVITPANEKAIENAGEKSQGQGVSSNVTPPPPPPALTAPVQLNEITFIDTTQPVPPGGDSDPFIEIRGYAARTNGFEIQSGIRNKELQPMWNDPKTSTGWWYHDYYCCPVELSTLMFIFQSNAAPQPGSVITVSFKKEGVPGTFSFTVPAGIQPNTYYYIGVDGRVYMDLGLTNPLP